MVGYECRIRLVCTEDVFIDTDVGFLCRISAEERCGSMTKDLTNHSGEFSGPTPDTAETKPDREWCIESNLYLG